MFIDNVKVKFLAGKGGNGIVAWRREKYLPKGGPYGGDGGKGGSITLKVDDHLISLEKFFNKQVIKAGNGKSGGTNNKQGKKGSDILIKVPVGTIVKDNEDNILFEFNKKEDEFLICKGGKGGRGNHAFCTPTNRAPNICTLGKIGEEKEILLELKLIADVGLIGMPNAGKSTLMKQLTKSKVKIAAYPFTTLFPNLGLIEFDDYSRSLMADIPGIIKGAHINKGLGLSFLKHIERTSILIFVIDITTQDPVSDFQILLDELKSYNENLLKRDFLTLINKMDLENENLESFKKCYPFSKDSLIEISALKNQGLDTFLRKLKPFCKNKF